MPILAQQYAVKQFTVDDGLPSSHVYEVKQDEDGFYWICTNEGLVKYDGYSFRLITSNKSKFNDDIWWTYQDRDNRIWMMSTGSDLWYLENDSFKTKTVQFDNYPMYANYRKLTQDTFNYYWMITGSRFFSFKEDSFAMYELIYEGKTNKHGFPEMYNDENGNVYFLSYGPLTVWGTVAGGKPYKIYEYEQTIYGGEAKSEGNASLNESNTTPIFNTKDSIYIIHKGQLTGYFEGKTFNMGPFPAAQMLHGKSFKVLKTGNKYAFINASGSFMTNSNFEHLPEYDFMREYNINTVYEDHEGSIWISTTDKGLLYLTKDALAAKSFNLEGLNTEVIGIETDAWGVKWIAFKNGTIISYDGGKLKKFYVQPKNKRDKNWYLRDIRIVNGYLALAVGNFEFQIFKLDENVSLTKPYRVYEVGNNHSKCLSVGADGNLYIVTYNEISKIDIKKALPKYLETYSNQRTLSASADKNGALIASSFGGLHKCTEYETKLLTYESHTKKFKAGPNKNLWLILKNRGLSALVNDSVFSVKALDNVVVNDICFEGDTIMWVASNEGLIKLNFAPQRNEYTQSRKLTLANGLLTNEVTSISTDSNYLYIGTSKGFNIIDRLKLTDVGEGYKVLLTNVSAKGEKLKITNAYDLSPDLNSVELSYVYISPKSAGHITYQYMLEGIDADWKTTNETYVSYPFLPPGNYTFLLRAEDINGTPSSHSIQLDITVREYWWKTTWFRVLLGIAIISLIIAFFLIRIKQLQKREQERSELNNRIAELKLKALQSQMDPHFVFNVLSSIQEFFISNNIESANKYLSDFSKLMRLFLDASDEKYISLDKEINLLTLYIELERMRIKNKFEYEFKVDDDVELDELYVPSMLMQPLIENAIKHGLKHKEADGKLIIEVNEITAGELLIIVEDNGIGRKKSSEINKTVRKYHKSKASNIIKERIEIINNSSEGEISLTYTDLMENDLACGTRAELKLNLKVNR